MPSWVYWVAAAGYLAGSAVLVARLSGAGRWLAVAGAVVLGGLLLLPATCRTYVLPVCTPGPPTRCDDAAAGCSTPVGLRVPAVDTLGDSTVRALALGLILAGPAAGLAARRRVRPTTRRP
jgi:hypothetical protein